MISSYWNVTRDAVLRIQEWWLLSDRVGAMGVLDHAWCFSTSGTDVLDLEWSFLTWRPVTLGASC